MRSCKLVGLLLLGALLLPPCIARAEEISIPAVEYDISGWEDIWREIQAETGGAAGGASETLRWFALWWLGLDGTSSCCLRDFIVPAA